MCYTEGIEYAVYQEDGMAGTEGDPRLVGCCGLYCGECGVYKRGRCPGCAENENAGWCKVRTCCLEHDYGSCADCAQFAVVRDCRKFNNFIARLFGFVFRSDREANIARIKAVGRAAFAEEMATRGRQSLRRGPRT
jgi:hypothetical protein